LKVIFLCRIFESRTKPPSLTVDRSFLSQKQASISPVTLASAIIIFYPASHTIIQCIIPALKCNNHDSTIARRSREREIKNGTFLHAKYQKKKKKRSPCSRTDIAGFRKVLPRTSIENTRWFQRKYLF